MEDSPSFPIPRVTLKDIAQKMGVSHATVSLALRNSSEIAQATRERVQRVAREMGYQPNAMAAGLAQFKRDSKVKPIEHSMAWLNFWPDPKSLRHYREFDLYWKGAAASAEKFGYRLEEFAVSADMPLRRLENILLARGITAVLLPPPGPAAPRWSDFNLDLFAAVRLGAPTEAPAVHIVGSDHARNAMLAFQKIRESGYQRIGYVGEPYRTWLYGAGFLWAQLMDCPPKLRLPPFMFNAADAANSQPAFLAWLKKERPDAIITEHAELPDMLGKVGYRVPADVGLAALTVLDCPIEAGIYQNPEEIGRAAVLVALSMIHDNARGIPPVFRQILIEGKWVDGASLPRR